MRSTPMDKGNNNEPSRDSKQKPGQKGLPCSVKDFGLHPESTVESLKDLSKGMTRSGLYT